MIIISYGDKNLKFALRDGKLGLYLDTYGINDQWIITTSELRDSKWHHVVATKTGNEVKLYVDTFNEKEDCDDLDQEATSDAVEPFTFEL